MRSLGMIVGIVVCLPSWACPQDMAAQGLAQQLTAPPFWQLPKLERDWAGLVPANVKLVGGPDVSRKLALLQIGDDDPTNYVAAVTEGDTGYRVIPGGLVSGALTYGDRPYGVVQLPDAFKGLTLLQTKLNHKPVVDGRFAIVLEAATPCLVFVAVDENSLKSYEDHGSPAWLLEYAPTGHQLTTDRLAGGSYRVFVKRVKAGRMALGPPCSDTNTAMYFAFFAAAK